MQIKNRFELQHYRSRLFLLLKILAATIVLALIGYAVHQLPVRDSLVFVLALFIIFYVPGDLLLRFSKLPDPFTGGRFIYSNALGLAIVSILYPVCRAFEIDQEYLYLPFILALFFWLLTTVDGHTSTKTTNQSRSDHISLGILVFIILLMLHFTYFSDAVLTADGYNIRLSEYTESIFHQGLINSLVDHYPPPSLYASEITDFSHYHIGMHLHIELIHRLFGISTVKLIYYYFAFYYFLLLATLSYSFVRSIGGSWRSAILGGLLIFGSDFSFVTGIADSTTDPWVLFYLPGVFTLFTYNGIIPGTVSFLTSILLFNHFVNKQLFSTAGVLLLVVVSAYIFKFSMGLHLTVAYTCVGFLMVVFNKSRSCGFILIGTFTSLFAIMQAYQHYLTGSIGSNVVKFMPFNMLSGVLDRIGLLEQPDYQKPALYIMYIIIALGVRYLGIHVLINTKWKMKVNSWCVYFIAVFFIIGYIVSEFIFIGIDNEYNNSIWFATQAFFGAWVLLFFFLVKMQSNRSRHTIAVLVISALAFPSTIQLILARNSEHYIEISADELEVIDTLKSTNPGSIILHPLNENAPSLASNFSGRSSVLNVYGSFTTAFIKPPNKASDIEHRYNDIILFFSEKIDTQERINILDRYSVDYIYCPIAERSCVDLEDINRVSIVMRNNTYSIFSISHWEV